MNEMGSVVSQFEGPERIGPYQLLARLAQGGMGTVYLARMTGPAGFNKLAVVKELKEELLGSSRFAKLFLDEARLAARLTHPNIVHTYGAGEDDGRLYIAMEYLDGQPWARVRHRLRANHALSIHVQLEVLADTLSGLHYAHELKEFNGAPLNVVHCDMSPQNVFITYDGQVKVVDFGVARATHNRETNAEVFLGKVAYCAPEQARTDPVDRRADIFAVGVMLWEALTGQRFALGNDPAQVLRARAVGAEPRVRDVAPDTYPALADICDRALSWSPGDPFATAAEFRLELTRHLAHAGTPREPTQLGRLVENAFESERKRIHGLIEHQLNAQTPISSMQPIADMSGAEPGMQGEHTLEADLSKLASVTRLTDEATMSSVLSGDLLTPLPGDSGSMSMSVPLTQRQPLPQSRLPLWVGVGTLLVGCATFAAVWLTSRPPPVVITSIPGTAPAEIVASNPDTAPQPERSPPPEDPTPPPSATAAPAHSPAPATLRFSFRAVPRDARLFLDGHALGENPFEADPAMDNAVHKLSASAPGYRTEAQAVVFDRDVSVVLRLRPLRRRPANRPTGPGQGPPPPRVYDSPAPPPPARADPNPPVESTGKAPPPAEPAYQEEVPRPSPARSGLEIYEEDPY